MTKIEKSLLFRVFYFSIQVGYFKSKKNLPAKNNNNPQSSWKTILLILLTYILIIVFLLIKSFISKTYSTAINCMFYLSCIIMPTAAFCENRLTWAEIARTNRHNLQLLRLKKGHLVYPYVDNVCPHDHIEKIRLVSGKKPEELYLSGEVIDYWFRRTSE